MSYKLEKSSSDLERANFIVKYNHNLGLKIEETENFIYALEDNEILQTNIDGEKVPIINPNYESEIFKAREKQFEEEFFETSLGWIRRQVLMRDGSRKDFLADLLPQIKVGLELAQTINIIAYDKPDFSKELNQDLLLGVQKNVIANLDFVKECLNRVMIDFYGE